MVIIVIITNSCTAGLPISTFSIFKPNKIPRKLITYSVVDIYKMIQFGRCFCFVINTYIFRHLMLEVLLALNE